MNEIFSKADFSDLPEFGVGHYTDTEAMTGCTCFVARGVCSDGCTCGVDVRGGGPATRETDLLRPENMVQKVNAVMLGGGSAFGLEAASGVMQELANVGMGFSVGPVRVPIVPAACLFDLLIGQPVWPTPENGVQACKGALGMKGPSFEMGSVGAGTGALAGRMGLPGQESKSGFGWAGAKFGDLVVIACTVVNAVGNVLASDGSWLAGVKGDDGTIMDPMQAAMMAAQKMREAQAAASQGDQLGAAGSGNAEGHSENTTLSVILTNAPLNKAQATKVAQQAQDGYARAIKPVHTLNDGDAIFVMASGTLSDPAQYGDFLTDLTGIMSADAAEDAIRNAVISAQ